MSNVIRTFLPPQPIRITAVGHVLLDPRWSVSLHDANWRIYFTRSQGGELRLTAPGRTMTGLEGRLHVVPPWSSWSATCTGPIEQVFVQFQTDLIPREWIVADLIGITTLARNPDHEALCESLRCQPLGALPITKQVQLLKLAASCLDEVISTLSPDQQQRLNEAVAAIDPLAPALALLTSRLAAPLQLDALAASCGMKRHRFAHLFRERLKTTPGRWLMQQRITVATDLLIASDDPIEAIAIRVGFANRFHFSRVFAQITGESPAAYRSQRQYSRLHRIRRLNS